ncbi:catalase [Sporanaerobium hydrogeniformans]|uniref:Catalase n=1 Tax=Sporanaerobium hydrogeniformans TaxID=3072179 RepID=A0AC61DFB6_9FIRM|nr:DUF5662 family protein [Sporanaerobium hydrogeniformans]PHV71969.1 catalase [Sporanaerobium hydrogeniformans]
MKIWEHFKTVTKHRHQVMKHCLKAGIFWQGCLHDLSKYSPTEFWVGAQYYSGTRSPNEKEREELGYSAAWLHHKGRNKHHFEYWTDYHPKAKRILPVKMPQNYVIEMFCDRVAASKIYLKDQYTDRSALEYFLEGRVRRDGMIHPHTSQQLEELLRMLAEEGEEKTFAYIRALKQTAQERKQDMNRYKSDES